MPHLKETWWSGWACVLQIQVVLRGGLVALGRWTIVHLHQCMLITDSVVLQNVGFDEQEKFQVVAFHGCKTKLE